MARDSAERTQADDALRRLTAQFETLLNNVPLGVYLIDGDFRIRQVNPTALPVFGEIPGRGGGKRPRLAALDRHGRAV